MLTQVAVVEGVSCNSSAIPEEAIKVGTRARLEDDACPLKSS